MIAKWLKVASVVSVAAAAGAFVGCGAQDFDASSDDVASGDVASGDVASGDIGGDENASMDDSDYGSAEEAVMSCTNPDGTNSVMAAFAVAVAQELGRWNASKDFIRNDTSGLSENSPGRQQAIKLASGSDASGPMGKSRCADGKCAKVQALLDLQYDQANNKVFIQGSGSTRVLLSPAALRSRMFAKWGEQRTCDAAPVDGNNNNCTREQNTLKFVSSAVGGCDTNFTFSVKGTNGAALRFPNQLKNELKFADSSANPYINFQNLGNGNVSIDPTYGLDEDPTGAVQACTSACTKISLSSLAGGCCSCGGVTKAFQKAAWNNVTFLCQ
jgi:hypothetical protein